MKNVTFYLLEYLPEQHESTDPLAAAEVLACELAAMHWREGKRVLIFCENTQQAERLDEALWQRPPFSFVPHNLAGEGPGQGAPVELAWPARRGNAPRDLLISLLPECATFASTFCEVIDFVPYETALKQQARERYTFYRRAGFHLKTATPPTN